jgi:hypothetical protein
MAFSILSQDTAPVGPYSRIRGSHAEMFCGGVNAFAREHSVDASSVLKEPGGTVIELTASDGQVWFARADGNMIVAFRDRTEQELRDLDEAQHMAYGVHFERVRLDACREIGHELQFLAHSMRPDACASRQHRRWLKRRMVALAEYQCGLLMMRPTSLPKLRADLQALNLRPLWP